MHIVEYLLIREPHILKPLYGLIPLLPLILLQRINLLPGRSNDIEPDPLRRRVMVQSHRFLNNPGQILLPLVMLFDPVVVLVCGLALSQPIVQLQILIVDLLVLFIPLILLFPIEVV